MAKTPQQQRQPSVSATRSKAEILRDPQEVASAILSIGAAAWKALSAWSNVDFLLSIREERFAVMFQFFETTGWWILLIFGLGWFIARWLQGPIRAQMPSWAVAISLAIVAFLFGVLMAVKSSGEIPNVIVGWGGAPGRCTAVIDTSRLLSFKDDYKLALACGILDPSVDALQDKRLTISSLFTIVPGGVAIVATEERQHVDLPPNGAALAHYVILLPNDVPIDKIATLSDVTNLGGKIINPRYYR